MKGEWLDALPPGSIAQMTSRGSMTTEAFDNWLTHFSRYEVAGSCLLVFDGATTHLDHRIVEATNCHYITLLCLPSQITHELQPMIKSVFGPSEHY
jgi:DDE superfamily endonuclease.